MFYIKSIDKSVRQVLVGDTVDNVDELHPYGAVAQAVFELNIPIKGVERKENGVITFKVYHPKLSESVTVSGDGNYRFEDDTPVERHFKDLSFHEKCKVLAVSMDLLTAVADYLAYDTDDGVEFLDGFDCYGFNWNCDAVVNGSPVSVLIEVISNDAIGLESVEPLTIGTGGINVHLNNECIFDFPISTDKSAREQVEKFKAQFLRDCDGHILMEK